MNHKIRIRLVHLNRWGVVDPKGTRPWKWRGDCICGWGCLSWQWIAIDRPGGTLPMAIEHLADQIEDLPTES